MVKEVSVGKRWSALQSIRKKAARAHANADPNPPPLQSGYQPASQPAIRNHCTASTHLIPPLALEEGKPSASSDCYRQHYFQTEQAQQSRPTYKTSFPTTADTQLPINSLGEKAGKYTLRCCLTAARCDGKTQNDRWGKDVRRDSGCNHGCIRVEQYSEIWLTPAFLSPLIRREWFRSCAPPFTLLGMEVLCQPSHFHPHYTPEFYLLILPI